MSKDSLKMSPMYVTLKAGVRALQLLSSNTLESPILRRAGLNVDQVSDAPPVGAVNKLTKSDKCAQSFI